MRLIKSIKGFSLAELMVTMGILGGMSLYVLDMISSIKDTERQSLAFFSISTVTMDITNALQDEQSCTETLRGLNPSLIFPNGTSIPAIRRLTSGITGANIRDLYIPGQVVDREAGGGGVIEIDDIQLSNYDTPAGGDLYRTSARQAFVTVSFKVGAAAGTGVDWDTLSNDEKAALRQRIGSSPIVIKRIPIQADLDGAGNIERCNAGGVWDDFLSDLCTNLFQGTPSGPPLSCINMKFHAVTGALEVGVPVPADTMLVSDGRFQVEDAHKTQFLKVGPTSTDYTINPGFNVQIENSLWTNALRVGSGTTSPGDGNLSYSGTMYIGDINNARPFRRSVLRLGAPGAPQGMEVTGGIGPGSVPTAEAIRVESGVVRMTEPPVSTSYTTGVTDAERVERSDAARVQWVSETLGRTLGDSAADIATIMDQIKANQNASGLAGNILKRYICVNTHMRRFSARDAREQTAWPAGNQYWLAGRINASGNCEFGIEDENDPNNLHLKRNCSVAGNCDTIEAQNSICISGVCKSRWPYIIQSTLCNWKPSCAANEMLYGTRPGAPTTDQVLCCQVRFEN